MVGESNIFRGRRAAACAVLSALVMAGVSAAPARADSTNFRPVVTASLGTDAARAASSFSLKITQKDGEEQIGRLAIALPRNPGFTVNTDVPTTNGAQVGTIRVVLYTNPRPGTLTIDGTLNDDNDRLGCGGTSGRQCIKANLNVPGVGTVSAQLEVNETTGAYTIAGDLTSTWADSSVAAIDARLSELSTTLYASVGSHTVVRNPPTAGTWPLRYELTSAEVPSRSLNGGRQPECTPSCSVGLVTKEYAPSAPGLVSPRQNSAYLTTATIPFAWSASTDRNGDPITYTLLVDGAPVAAGLTTRAVSASLPAGLHNWRVVADDGRGTPTNSFDWRVAVIDPASAITFTSVTNSDVLYVDPVLRAFVYQVADGASHGAIAPSVTAPVGYIAFNGGFTLAMAYDATTGSAAGTFVGASQPRPFLDPPGS